MRASGRGEPIDVLFRSSGGSVLAGRRSRRCLPRAFRALIAVFYVHIYMTHRIYRVAILLIGSIIKLSFFQSFPINFLVLPKNPFCPMSLYRYFINLFDFCGSICLNSRSVCVCIHIYIYTQWNVDKSKFKVNVISSTYQGFRFEDVL